MSKDYYRVLGVLDDAEDIVVKAAYKALAQRYHPDKWVGDKTEANRRMTEINEAYGVLSDPVKRKEYDSERDQANFQAEPEADDLNSSVEADWNKVIEYFPDLVGIAAGLAKLSPSLAYSYKVILLDTKTYSERQTLAVRLENHFLEKYFGSNKEIKEFAKYLILKGYRSAAKELNEAVNLLGSNIEADIIKDVVQKKFQIDVFDRISESLKYLKAANLGYVQVNNAKDILRQLGYDPKEKIFSINNSYFLTIGKDKVVVDGAEFIEFAIEVGEKYLRGE